MCLRSLRCCFFLFLCFYQKGRAQYTEENFIRYTIKEGLSDNRINCLQQDDWGYLWIGTDEGLNRFDGNSFKKFYQESRPLNLSSDNVSRLKRFGSHQLGIFTRSGFKLLDTKTYATHSYLIHDSTAFTTPMNNVWDAVQLPDGSFALSTAAGFYVMNEAGNILFRHDAFSVNDIGRKRLMYGRDIFKTDDHHYLVYVNDNDQALYDDHRKSFQSLTDTDADWSMYAHPLQSSGNYWITKCQLDKETFLFIPHHTDSIIYYNHAAKKRVVSKLPFSVEKELNWTSKMEKVNDSVVLINCGNRGFYRLIWNPVTGVVNCDGKKLLQGYEIICLMVDKDQRLWVGTSEGLLKQELNPSFINVYPCTPPKGFASLSSVYRYKQFLYVGNFSRKEGLCILDAATMQLQKCVQFFGEDLLWNEVRSIQMYHSDTLWLGTSLGILWYDTHSGHYGKVLDEKKFPWAINFDAILAPLRPDGYAWMCSLLGGRVVRYHPASRAFTVFTSQTKPALPFDRVKSIAYDAYGDVWIGGHSLARWNNRLQVFDTLIKVYAGPNKFNDDIVTFKADDQGSLWLHNADNGLLEYRILEKKFIYYGTKDGLPSHVLRSLSPVIGNQLWIAGNNHLCLFNIRTKKIIVYDYNDGLPQHKPSARSIYYDAAEKQMYLCSNNELVRFPLNPPNIPDRSSALLLEEVSVNNERTLYQPPDHLTVKFNENYITFHFTVIDFDKGNYQAAYRLKPSDKWTHIGTQHSISFNNLSPGEYNLELKAWGKSGTEKKTKLFLVIRPPFWLSVWFLSLVAVLIFVAVYLLLRARIRIVRQRANLDRLLLQTEMKALQAQMNPHFIFNSLNSIREMILNNENKEASHYLSKFAHLIRITLDQSSQTNIPLRATVDYLNRYMEMETIRNSLFTYEVNVDEQLDLDETFVSPTLIQPFIENAIWHGVSATRKNIRVCVEFKKQDDALVCIIDDDGVGIELMQSIRPLNSRRYQSRGIANIKNRITLLNEKYKHDCGITVTDKKELSGESGTRVILQLPLQTNES